MSREDRASPPARKTTWFERTPISMVSAPTWVTTRASSSRARAGTLASKLPSSGASSFVSLTLRR